MEENTDYIMEIDFERAKRIVASGRPKGLYYVRRVDDEGYVAIDSRDNVVVEDFAEWRHAVGWLRVRRGG